MIGTPVDHTALSLSGGAYSSDCSFNCAALQRQHRELDWGGKREGGGDFCIFLFVVGRTRVCQGEGSPYCFTHLKLKFKLYRLHVNFFFNSL